MTTPFLVPTLALALATDSAFAPDRLFVTHIDSETIEFLDSASQPQPFASATSTQGQLGVPFGIAFSPRGELYVGDGSHDRIVVLDSDGLAKRTIGVPGDLTDPRCLAFGPQGELYVTSATGPAVTVFGVDGKKSRVLGGQFGTLRAEGIAFGPGGHVFVASQWNDVVYEFDPSGAVVGSVGAAASLDDPIGVAFGPDGRLYVASENTHEIVVFDDSHLEVGRFGPEFGLHYPLGLAFGPDARLYVASLTDEAIHVFTLVDAQPTAHSALPLPGVTAFLAFSPHTRKVSLKGDFTQPGEFAKDHLEVATLTYSPNFNVAFVALADDGSSPLAAAFGPVFAFAGSHAITDSFATKRQFLGQQIPQGSTLTVSAALGLKVVTAPQVTGVHTFLKASGDFDASRQGVIFRGEIRTKQ